MIEPYVIDKLEEDRRHREESLRVPLHITPPPPPPVEEDPRDKKEDWSVVVDFEV